MQSDAEKLWAWLEAQHFQRDWQVTSKLIHVASKLLEYAESSAVYRVKELSCVAEPERTLIKEARNAIKAALEEINGSR